MVADFKAKLQAQIRRRAFVCWDRQQREKQRWQNIQHTLDALQEVTELSRSELEEIARDVRLSCAHHDEKFFSIKNQILVASGIVGLVIIAGWLLIKL